MYKVMVDSSDVIGEYESVAQGMEKMYEILVEEIDKHYTEEEKLEYHEDGLAQLKEMIQADGKKNREDFKRYLRIYSELSPNDFSLS
ncbi:hypothetical protein [Staphylococcus warneri]|uniref:hypothetical protein n=1 Tax=Staphylococcus warneri TaxID=1292 RepID=UPI001A8DBE1F|nr:hypothetical protein [Staphylococcus warneri]MBO0377049.1 hypothetical protein [Staphylococcus warneri]